jgi:hypothetical protein
MQKNSKFILISSASCIIACIGEFITIFVLGNYYPGYNQLKNTMSSLGASISPVSNIISAWWVIMGILFIIFGIGFKKAFAEKGKAASVAAWFIILYGLGEGIGSGAFKADHINDAPTTLAIIHDILGGIGVTAILIFPLLMKRLIENSRIFNIFSIIIFVTGILTISLFLFRYSADENSFLTVYKGLWQRLFMLNTYLYQTTIAIIMIREANPKTGQTNLS